MHDLLLPVDHPLSASLSVEKEQKTLERPSHAVTICSTSQAVSHSNSCQSSCLKMTSPSSPLPTPSPPASQVSPYSPACSRNQLQQQAGQLARSSTHW